jgi:hypothetical protein
MNFFSEKLQKDAICWLSIFVKQVTMIEFITVTEVKCWVTESDLDLFSVCMSCNLFSKGDKSWQKYRKITRENLWTGYVENESHFLFEYEKYSNYRRSFQCNILSILHKNHLSEN